ncbi:putative Transcription factor [Quillaja saponaria]|uniref:Transcription factor n=1 Tax=Quillaja saponaria TaxID=32244 RepID=A0AAD7PAY8_QUISA|nr:putative Transcription factor [Quillaja saponaria]
MELEKDKKVVMIGKLDPEIPLLLPVDVREMYISKPEETMCEVLSSTRTATSSSMRLFNILHFDEENAATAPVLPPQGIQDLVIKGCNNIQNMLSPANYGLNCSSELLSTSSPPTQNHQLHFTNNAPLQNVSEAAASKDVRSSSDVQSANISEVKELSGGGVKKSGNEAAAAVSSKRPRNETMCEVLSSTRTTTSSSLRLFNILPFDEEVSSTLCKENVTTTPVLSPRGIKDIEGSNNIQNMLTPANYGLNCSSELLSTSSPPRQNHQLHFTNNAPFQNASDSATIKDVESRFDVQSVNISEVRELSGGGVKTSRNEAVAASKRPRNETMCEVLSSTRTTTSSSLRLFNVLHFDEIYDQEVSSILCKENVATRPVLPPHGIQDLDIEGGNNIQNMLTPTNYGLNCSSELLSTSSPPKQNHQLHFTNNAPFQNVSESAAIKDVRSSFDVQSVHISEVRELSGGGVKKSGNEAAAASKRPRNETPSPFSAFKVRKVKLGDTITALQKLVSPFGKTGTDSVLVETIDYIRFLHAQVTVLSNPYMKKNGAPIQHQQDSSKCKISDQGPSETEGYVWYRFLAHFQ